MNKRQMTIRGLTLTLYLVTSCFAGKLQKAPAPWPDRLTLIGELMQVLYPDLQPSRHQDIDFRLHTLNGYPHEFEWYLYFESAPCAVLCCGVGSTSRRLVMPPPLVIPYPPYILPPHSTGEPRMVSPERPKRPKLPTCGGKDFHPVLQARIYFFLRSRQAYPVRQLDFFGPYVLKDIEDFMHQSVGVAAQHPERLAALISAAKGQFGPDHKAEFLRSVQPALQELTKTSGCHFRENEAVLKEKTTLVWTIPGRLGKEDCWADFEPMHGRLVQYISTAS